MKKLSFTLIAILCVLSFCFAQGETLLIDDFEGPFDGKIDFGSGNGSTIEVTANKEIKHSGEQSMKIAYEAVLDGYMWAARGSGLDVPNAGWLVKPEDIDWKEYDAIAFYVYGTNSGAKVAFDIKDNGKEIWRFMFEDNFTGWKQVVCFFNDFFVRRDWQPEAADKNAALDFPIQSFQFEPRPQGKGTLYIDEVELIKKK